MTLSKRAAIFAASCVVAGAPISTARADDETGVLVSRHEKYATPEHFMLELRVGLYHPRVDSAPGYVATSVDPYPDPYEYAFGDTANLELAIEFDWTAYRIPHFGTIGPGFSAGYTSASALAKLQTPEPSGVLSAESTGLTVYPMYGVVVLRADVIDRELHVPLVPYVKAGFGWALWRASDSAGTSVAVSPTTGQPVQGEGKTFGTQVALGLAFDLNVLDLAAARQLDSTVGVNHTYAFFEAFWANLDGLGQSHALYVGAYTWAAGLAVSF
jgi:hypothetical protein